MNTVAERVAMWVSVAIDAVNDGRLDDAEIAASEAGRYRGEMPDLIKTNPVLKRHFEKGRADSIEDAADAERAERVASVAFDSVDPDGAFDFGEALEPMGFRF